MARRGLIYDGPEGRIQVPACAVEAVDTTAAGDTFIGFFLASRLQGATVQDSLQLACRARGAFVSLAQERSIPFRDERNFEWLSRLVDNHMNPLSHFDDQGASRMVDVSAKPETERVARASGLVRMQPATLALIKDRGLAKGDVLEVARLAGHHGGQAHRRVDSPVPSVADHCRPPSIFPLPAMICCASRRPVRVLGRTGVEMEALTAVSVAGPDRLRHVQVGRSRHDHRTHPA